jgi:hypothetical protein
VTAIWENDGEGWRVASPSAFEAEAQLHDLVERAPELLPLSGTPSLVVVGREVALGNGYADLIGVEVSGRPVVIEIKLAANSEARRAVVTQVLAYAAYLHGRTPEEFERSILARHLRERGVPGLWDAVTASQQAGAERDGFEAGLAEALRTGQLRVVIVLDRAPRELIELIGFLEVVAERLTVDLITVSKYDIGGSTILVPQRVDPERRKVEEPTSTRATGADGGYLSEGPDDFVAMIDRALPEEQQKLRRLIAWAEQIATEGLASLSSYHGKNSERFTLLPRLKPDNSGLVTVWNDAGAAYLQLWRSVFERRAPRSLDAVEERLGKRIGQGTTTREVTEDLLNDLTMAYREAGGRLESAVD